MRFLILNFVCLLSLLPTFSYGSGFFESCNFHLRKETPELDLLQRLEKPSPEQITERHASLNWSFIQETLFILPANDGEARRSVNLLRSIGAPHLHISQQEWGAKLGLEPISNQELRGVKKVLTFEMPGIEKEEELRHLGKEVLIVDHHAYPSLGLERTKPESSLEQLMHLIGWKPTQEDLWIAVNDRSFIPGLKKENLTAEQIRTIRKFDYLAQGKSWAEIEDRAKLVHAKLRHLEQNHGYYRLENEDTTFIREHLAIESETGVVNVLEVNFARGKMGFSGNPAVAERLLQFDYGSLGYPPGSYETYAVGNPPSRLWGLKILAAPAGESTLLPQRVADAIEAEIRKIVE